MISFGDNSAASLAFTNGSFLIFSLHSSTNSLRANKRFERSGLDRVLDLTTLVVNNIAAINKNAPLPARKNGEVNIAKAVAPVPNPTAPRPAPAIPPAPKPSELYN